MKAKLTLIVLAALIIVGVVLAMNAPQQHAQPSKSVLATQTASTSQILPVPVQATTSTTSTTAYKSLKKPIKAQKAVTTTSEIPPRLTAEQESKIPNNDSEISEVYCPDQCSPLTPDSDQ